MIVLIVGALVSEFFVALARERGYYDHPSRTLSAVFDFLLRNPFVHSIGGAIVGFAVGVWTYSGARSKELESAAAQAALPRLTKQDSRIAVIAKAREMATSIRHVLTNRGLEAAITYYRQFENESIDAMEILLRALGGIPPVTRNLDVPSPYWKPSTEAALNALADDLDLLADAVEKKVRGA